MSLVLSLTLQAQNDVTRFLGIPVDGHKDEMIRQLKNKGFRSTAYDADFLEGEFNGSNVRVYVVTNKNKVCRIAVSDVNNVDETAIRIRFNTLCRQFSNNPKYLSLYGDQTLPDDEDISYEISVHKKRYEAVFYQRASAADDTTDDFFKRSVWLMISDHYGKYYITLFYDNEYNRAQGDDL